MSVYTVALPKGGSGKTTTAAEIAATLARQGRKVLAVDLDRQGNYSARFGITGNTPVAATTADVLAGSATAQKAAISSPTVPGVDVLIGTHQLRSLDGRGEIVTSLRDHLPDIVQDWDDVVIDTPPAGDLLTLTGLAAADVCIASVVCTGEALAELPNLRDLIAGRIAPRLNKGLEIGWIIPTRYDSRRRLDREVIDALNEFWPGKVTTTVREAVAAADAYNVGMPVGTFAPRAPVSDDYAKALAYIL